MCCLWWGTEDEWFEVVQLDGRNKRKITLPYQPAIQLWQTDRYRMVQVCERKEEARPNEFKHERIHCTWNGKWVRKEKKKCEPNSRRNKNAQKKHTQMYDRPTRVLPCDSQQYYNLRIFDTLTLYAGNSYLLLCISFCSVLSHNTLLLLSSCSLFINSHLHCTEEKKNRKEERRQQNCQLMLMLLNSGHIISLASSCHLASSFVRSFAGSFVENTKRTCTMFYLCITYYSMDRTE